MRCLLHAKQAQTQDHGQRCVTQTAMWTEQCQSGQCNQMDMKRVTAGHSLNGAYLQDLWRNISAIK